MSYSIPLNSAAVRFEIKKSVFHARVGIAQERKQAMDFLSQCKLDFPDARHHCWAYLLGNPQSPENAAMSDDGEPSGTAGKPIFNVLQHSGIGDIVLVVSRYFGGVKLGAGGLVRAYSASAQQAIDNLAITTKIKFITVYVRTDFKHEQGFRHFVEVLGGQVDQCDYANDVQLIISVPFSILEQLRDFARMRNATCAAL